jgi:type II secretory pathway pseudopilin PulG
VPERERELCSSTIDENGGLEVTESTRPPRAPLMILVVAMLLFLMSAIWFGIPQVRFAAEQGQVTRAQMQLGAFLEATEEYRRTFGELPDGTPAEVAAALLGENSGRQVFLQVTTEGTNALGQLVDPWGTAWEIWQVSEDRLEARSAGPNRRYGDHDDLIASRAVRRD